MPNWSLKFGSWNLKKAFSKKRNKQLWLVLPVLIYQRIKEEK
jgi:hypothetical protein